MKREGPFQNKRGLLFSSKIILLCGYSPVRAGTPVGSVRDSIASRLEPGFLSFAQKPSVLSARDVIATLFIKIITILIKKHI